MMEMCNCIEQTEQRYKEHLIKNDPKFKEMEDFDVEFKNKAIMFSKGTVELVIPIEVEWKHTAKSGRVSTKRKTSNFTMNYCPFCGEEIRSKEKDGGK